MNQLLAAVLSILCTAGLLPASTALNSGPEKTVSIAATSTEVCQKVLLGTITTRVDLDIGDLTLKEGCLQGTYSVNVDASTVPAPFRFVARSKNEAGRISLPFNHIFSDFAAEGGTLTGQGYCIEKDKSRIITCEVIPNEMSSQSGTIKVTIDTGNRIMDFTSHYLVTGS